MTLNSSFKRLPRSERNMLQEELCMWNKEPLSNEALLRVGVLQEDIDTNATLGAKYYCERGRRIPDCTVYVAMNFCGEKKRFSETSRDFDAAVNLVVYQGVRFAEKTKRAKELARLLNLPMCSS